MRIDEEEREDLTMARFGRVFQFKGGDAVLKDIREREQTALSADDISDFLHLRALLFTAENGLEPFVVVLRVTDVLGIVRALLTEGEPALRDILAVIVVQRSGTDMLILFQLAIKKQLVCKEGEMFTYHLAFNMP